MSNNDVYVFHTHKNAINVIKNRSSKENLISVKIREDNCHGRLSLFIFFNSKNIG